MRDLFQGDDGGWFQDVALVDKMVADRLEREAETMRAEGWKWIEVAPDFAYGHTFGLRQLRGEAAPLTDEETAAREALQAEFDRLSEEHADADELPDEVDERLGELETALEVFETRPLVYEMSDVARAGAFVSIAQDGSLRIERGYVRPEDELPVETEAETANGDDVADELGEHGDGAGMDAHDQSDAELEEEDEGLAPISDRLMTELTAHRTLGLRQALGEQPQVAFHAALHALTLKVFYHYGSDSCLELELKSVGFGAQARDLNDSASAEAIRVRHDSWAKALPKDSADLWVSLQEWDADSQAALFAHVVGLSVNAVHEPWNRRPRALTHANRLAEAVGLDMAAAGWKPTVDNFFGRVTKARILQAVAEAKGQRAADRIEHLKKGEMAQQAETLLSGSGWLPEPLRTPGQSASHANETSTEESGVEETAAIDGETAMGEADSMTEDEPVAVEPRAAAE
jgi:ParB family chromosome partitioning protein